MDPTVLLNLPTNIIDSVPESYGKTAIAVGPMIKVPGYAFQRIVLRRLHNQYVVHTQIADVIEDNPEELHYISGRYFPFKEDNELDVFKSAYRKFTEKCQEQLHRLLG